MIGLAFIEPAGQMRRLLFALASGCSISALAFLIYCIIQGRLYTYPPATDMASVSDFRDWLIRWLRIIILHLVGSYLCADLLVELYRHRISSNTIWTDRRHFKIVLRVWITTLAGLYILYSAAYKAMLDPVYGSYP
jgi:hypothetical protein